MRLGGCYAPSEISVAYAAREVGLLCSEGRAPKIKLLDAVWAFRCSVLCWVLLALFLVINSQLVSTKAKRQFCRLAPKMLMPVVGQRITCTQNDLLRGSIVIYRSLTGSAQSCENKLCNKQQRNNPLAKLSPEAHGFRNILELVVNSRKTQSTQWRQINYVIADKWMEPPFE